MTLLYTLRENIQDESEGIPTLLSRKAEPFSVARYRLENVATVPLIIENRAL